MTSFVILQLVVQEANQSSSFEARPPGGSFLDTSQSPAESGQQAQK